jgi:hypothetical protein
MTTSISQEKTKAAPATAATKARVAKRPAPVTPAKSKAARKGPPPKKATPAPHGGKTAKVLDLLKRPGGVTLKELMKATGWQAHSVRGFLSAPSGRNWGLRLSLPNAPTASAPTASRSNNSLISTPPCLVPGGAAL